MIVRDYSSYSPDSAYSVHNRVEHQLDAAMVYERLLACSHDSEMPTPARRLLRAAIVDPFRANEETPFVSTEIWAAMPPSLVKEWRQTRIAAIFPYNVRGNATSIDIDAHAPFPHFLSRARSLLHQPAAGTQVVPHHGHSPDVIIIVDRQEPPGSKFGRSPWKRRCGHDAASDVSVLSTWDSFLFQMNQDKTDRDQHILAVVLAHPSRFKDPFPFLIRLSRTLRHCSKSQRPQSIAIAQCGLKGFDGRDECCPRSVIHRFIACTVFWRFTF